MSNKTRWKAHAAASAERWCGLWIRQHYPCPECGIRVAKVLDVHFHWHTVIADFTYAREGTLIEVGHGVFVPAYLHQCTD